MKLAIPLLAMMIVAASAQTGARFEVATIKPNKSGERGEGTSGPKGGMFVYHNGTLKSLLLQAYGLRFYQIAGGPSWFETDRWDVEAKAEEKLTFGQAWEMMRALLADRFQLKL